ncbi:MAG TPA: carboxypeptidase regulatory-like domain-containing protein [Bryobacteraceae bacterium]|nr:carboxypeptidase regulatory-like domain-containing protein [Bryobacteraceae bacterium]
MKHRFLPAVFLFAVAAMSVSAQENVNFASLGGRVTDPSGAIIEGAQVSARQTETNLTSRAISDREGRFRFPYLRVGTYEIRVHYAGFTDAVLTATLTVGSAFDLPVSLTVQEAGTNITVSSESAVLEMARTQIAETVSREELASLPMNGRNFLDLALLVPGASPTNTGSNQLFAETSAVPGQGISVGSQRNFSNNFIVDGLSANDDASGLSGAFYSLDVVHEFQLVTSGGQAELGRALGGYINMITRSGTNQTHGDLYGYFRNQRFNAANPLSHTTLPMTQAQYGASLGGPIVRDRSFYFANFEQRGLHQSGLVTVSPANADAINARLRASGYLGSPVMTGLYSNPVHNTNFLGKVDRQFGASDQFSIRYNLYDVHSDHSRGAGGLNAASASAGLDDTDQAVAVSNVATLTSKTVNETRAQFARSSLHALPSDPIGPGVSISGVATFGTMSGAPTGRVNNLYEIVDNLSHQEGAHSLRAGVDVLYNDLAITYPRSVRGRYTFSSLASFLQGTYNNLGFTQTFGNSMVPQTNPNAGFYVQDEWKAGTRLTFNLGARYDLQFLKSIATDTNNVSPRAGFAWSPFASRRTVVRGSFGLFYDRVPLRALANALLSSGNTTTITPSSQLSVSLSPAQAGAPEFPNILPAAALPPGVLFNFSTMNRNMQTAYSEQGSLEIEQQIGGHSTLSLGYQHLRGLHLILSLNQNAPVCVAAANNNGCRPNPNYANNSQYSPLGDSRYDALHVSYVLRPVRWGSYRVSYDFSKALDDVGEFFFSSPIDNFNIWRDYGRSDDDQRHRVVVDASVHTSMAPAKSAWQQFTHGFELSGMLQYYSALPLNITSGLTTIQGTTGRPIVNGEFIGRNAGTGSDLFSLNTRVSRVFRVSDRLRLEAIAEAFNTLNHRNNLTKNGVFGTGVFPTNPAPAFGQVTAVNDPRSLQLAVRLTF